MAKYCYKQFNGKWYLDSDIELLKELSQRAKDGEDVSQRVNDILSKGKDKPPGEIIDDFLSPGRMTRIDIKKDFEKMDMVFKYDKKERVSVEQAIERAIAAKYISEDGSLSSELDIATKAINGQGLNSLEQIAIQRAMAVTRDNVIELDQMITKLTSLGQSTIELNNYLESAKAQFDLFAYAFSLNSTDVARSLVYISHTNYVMFDKKREMARLEAAFPNATPKQMEKFNEIVDKIDQKRKELTEAEFQMEKSKQKAARSEAAKGFNQVKNEAKQKQKASEPKDKSTYEEVRSKSIKDPLGTFKAVFRGDYKDKIKFQGDDTQAAENQEENDRIRVTAILGLARHLVKEEKIRDLDTLVTRVMEVYEDIETIGNKKEPLKESDVIDALALKSSNSKKLPEYTKALMEIKASAKKIKELSELLNVKVTDIKNNKRKDPDGDVKDEKIRKLIKDLQNIHLAEFELSLTPAEQEQRFIDLENISEALRIIDGTASEEVIKQKSEEILRTIAKLNSDKVEKRLQKKLDDLKDNQIVDTRKNYIKPFLTSEAFKLKEEYQELRNYLKNLEIEAEFDKYFEKYSDTKLFGLGISKRSLMKKLAAFKNTKFWWFLASRYRLGLDLGIMLLHGGYDTFAILGKTLYQFPTQRGRAQIATNLKGLANFWKVNFYAFTMGMIRGEDAKKDILDAYHQMTYNPHVTLARQLGLTIVRPFSTELITKQDDYFFGKGISDILEGNNLLSKHILKPAFSRFDVASEGSYVMGLNVMRMNLFQAYVDSHPNATIEELRAIVKEINTTTGSPKFDKDISVLSFVFTAPKLYFSRLRLIAKSTFGMYEMFSSDPAKRAAAKYRFENLVGFALGFSSTVFLLGLAGWEWERDPRSPNFLKLVKGDQTMDLTVGLGKWIYILSTIPIYIDAIGNGGKYAEMYWGPPEMGEEFRKQQDDPETAAFRKLSYMLNGTLHAIAATWTRESAVGEPYGTDTPSFIKEWLVNNYLPMSYSRFFEEEYKIDPENAKNKTLLEEANDSFMQVIGTGLMSYENNIKHAVVEDYLSKPEIDLDVKKNFNRQQIEKYYLPEVAETSYRNNAIVYRFRDEVTNAVGTIILNDINDNFGEGTLNKKQIQSITKREARRLATLYKEKYFSGE